MYEPAPRLDHEPRARLEYDDEIPVPHSRLTDELIRRNRLDQARGVTVGEPSARDGSLINTQTSSMRRRSLMRTRHSGAAGCHPRISRR